MSEGRPSLEIEEKPREACGVVGVWMPNAPDGGGPGVAQLTVAALRAVQHRGYDGAGVFVIDSEHGIPFVGNKGEGSVTEALPDAGYFLGKTVPDARIGVGHVRYGTNQAGGFDAAQPFHKGSLVLSDNGHVEGMDRLLMAYGFNPADYESDSEAKALLLSHLSTQTVNPETGQQKGVLGAIHELAPQLEGAFSWVIGTDDQIIGVRDPQGHRPLMLGHFEESKGFMLASEQAALHASGAAFVRDIEPGEVISISDRGIFSTLIDREQSEFGGLCSMEMLYFARPDGSIDGRNVYAARKSLGALCAQLHPAEADIVVGVPETGMHSAAGFAESSQIPLALGIFRNPDGKRSFMQPTQEARAQAVRHKLWPNRPELAGKRVVLIDDTVVRGTTMNELVHLLRRAGATEVHIRVPAAPLINPCFQGIDIGNPKTLLARQAASVEAMREAFGADSMAYLDVASMRQAIGSVGTDLASEQRLIRLAPRPARKTGAIAGQLCTACMDGNYPIKVPQGTDILPELKQKQV